MLHNFAANNEMYGVLEAVAVGPIKARSSYNSTMVGIYKFLRFHEVVIKCFLYFSLVAPYMQIGVGMCMEGIEQNPVMYDLMSEMAFRHDPVDVEV